MIYIMGIPSYFSYIVKRHGNIIQNFNNTKMHINNLLLDCNSIIYDCVRTIEVDTNNYENKLIQAICEKIKYYINTIKPNHTVYIAFDGVAPIAKLEQQRTRRYKSHFINNITSTILNKNNERWDTTNITPGTNFMSLLDIKIKEYFKDPRDFNVINLLISTSLDAGEGEHKLFEDIRKDSEYLKQSTVIYGLDADLIMLSLNHIKYCDKIYLFRETPEFIKQIDASLNPNELYILDINNLLGCFFILSGVLLSQLLPLIKKNS